MTDEIERSPVSRCSFLLSRSSCSRLLLPALAILLAVLIMYGYFLVPPLYPKLFGTYDYCRYFGPQAYFMDHAIHDGEFPLWNPLALCGMPFAASPQQTAFYPPHLLRSLLTFHPTPFRTHVGLALLMMLHMVLAGTSTYALARDYRLSRSASLVAALAFVFGPHFVRRVMEQWILAAVASWLPLLLFLFRRALRTTEYRSKVYYAIAAGLVFGISTLAGFPQLTLYTVIAMGLFWLLERILELTARARGHDQKGEAVHSSTLRLLVTDGAVLGAIFVLGAAVAMPMLLPASEFVRGSARLKSNGLEVNAAAQDLSAKHLLQSMVAYEGATFSEQGCRAAGLGVLFLAFMAFAHPRRRDVTLYVILYLILTDCTLGPPFPFGKLVYLLDVFQFSSPWRAGILAGLPMAMLAGFGVDGALHEWRSRHWAVMRSLFIVVVGIAAWWVLFLWFKHDLPAMNREGSYFPLTQAVLLVPMITLAVMVVSGWLPFPRLFGGLLLILVFVEMFLWNSSYFPAFIAKSGYKDKPDVVAGAERINLDNARWADPAPNTFFYTLKPSMNGYDPVCLTKVRNVLCAPSRETQYLRTVKNWEVAAENHRGNLLLKRPFWLARQYVRGALPPKDVLFPSTTTAFLHEPPAIGVPEVAPSAVSKHGVSDHTEKVMIGDATLFASHAKPSVQDRCKLPVFATGNRHSVLCIQYVAKGTTDVSIAFRDVTTGKTALGKRCRVVAGGAGVLEYPLPDFGDIEATLTWKTSNKERAIECREAYVLRDLDDEDGLITVKSWRANAVDIALKELPERRLLVFTDAMYPGWRAYVDGIETPIHTADDVFKAIVVPAGNHDVRFAFSSWRVTLGVIISVMVTGAILAGMCRCRPRPKEAAT